jgi:hypothetical protein
MAFPSTVALDTFDTGGVLLNSGNYAQGIASNDDCMKSDNSGGSAGGHTQTHSNESRWTAASFTDCEVWTKFTTLVPTDDYVDLYARITSPGAGLNAYRLEIQRILGASNDTWKLHKVVGGSFTQLGSTVLQDVANGDGYGLSCVGTTISVYYFNGTSWNQTPLIAVTDSAVAGSGQIGFASTSNVVRVAPFAGGAAVTGVNYTLSLTGDNYVISGADLRPGYQGPKFAMRYTV